MTAERREGQPVKLTAAQKEASTHFVQRNGRGEIMCASCPKDLGGFPASAVAHYQKTDGSGWGAWAVCCSHEPAAMCAGWFPVITVAEYEAARAALKANADG